MLKDVPVDVLKLDRAFFLGEDVYKRQALLGLPGGLGCA